MNNLTRFENEGIEIFVNQSTGESFASIRGVARMSGKPPSTISRFVTSRQIPVIKARIATVGGKQTAQLVHRDAIRFILATFGGSVATFKYFDIISASNFVSTKTRKQLSVYLVGNLEHKVCKIGIAQNVEKRLASIQTGCPYKLMILGVLSGDKTLERALHYKHRYQRLEGEWFSLDDLILRDFDKTQQYLAHK